MAMTRQFSNQIQVLIVIMIRSVIIAKTSIERKMVLVAIYIVWT